jgi:hypothetical protein
MMNALPVAARFAAFTFYLNVDSGQPRFPEAAGRYARENWKAFLPMVDRNLARFLTRDPSPHQVRHGGSLAAAVKTAKARAVG